jgi:cytochrome c553
LRCSKFSIKLKTTPDSGVVFFCPKSTMRPFIRIVFAAAVLCATTSVLPQAEPVVEAKPAKAEICEACHGKNGNATDPQYPILAGQTWRYIYIELKDFNEGRRSDPQMSPMAVGLTRDEMMALGNWFAAQKYLPTGFKADPAKVAAGKAKADEVLCAMCHLGNLSGQNEIPRVAGQRYEYVLKQLKDFKAKIRTNDAGNMTSVASTLSDTDIENLAQYAASLD